MRKILAVLFLLIGQPAWAGITCTLPYNLQNNTTADANEVMANYNALVTCFTNAAAAGINSDITALLALSTPISPGQGGTPVYFGGTSGGTANAQTVASLTPSGFTLQAGKRATFIASLTNLGATTLALNGLTAKNVYRMSPSGPQALTGGEIIVGNVVEVIYDGTEYQLLSVQQQFGGNGPQTPLASNTTTDLGLVFSHNAYITGNTTITSFGSSASTTYPVYNIVFGGAMVLTYNATSLVLPGAANITTALNDSAVAMYGGSGNWSIISYTKASGVAVVNPTPLCGANGLVIANSGNTTVNMTADSAVLINSSNNAPIYVTSAFVSINETTNGANGLDTGSLANNSFYHHYLISNGTTTAGLSSLSATAPTMPAGYIYKCRLGASKTNGSANFYGFWTSGNTTQYLVGGSNLSALPAIVTGTVGGTPNACTTTTPSWAALTVKGTSGAAVWVPSTATDIQTVVYAATASEVVEVAPNASYAGITSASDNQPPLALAAIGSISGWLKFESNANTIQACATESTRLAVLVQSWKDAVNAN